MSFGNDVKKFTKKTEREMIQKIRVVGAEALRRVVMKTPVDTGRARGSWAVGLNVINVKQSEDAFGSYTVADGIAEINKYKVDDVIYISNNLPYINKLENGSSKQAPQGMVKTTLKEIKNIL
jgi:hypothetical protein